MCHQLVPNYRSLTQARHLNHRRLQQLKQNLQRLFRLEETLGEIVSHESILVPTFLIPCSFDSPF
jgi:hypothetical protein